MIGVEAGRQIQFLDDEGSHISYDTIDGEIMDIINTGGGKRVNVVVKMGGNIRQLAMYEQDSFGLPSFRGYRSL